jgi:hypothetical protein
MHVKQTKTFRAHDDNGQAYVLNLFTEYDRTAQGQIEGLSEIRTRDGLHVNRLDKGKYEILTVSQPHIFLHSDDSDAP